MAQNICLLAANLPKFDQWTKPNWGLFYSPRWYFPPAWRRHMEVWFVPQIPGTVRGKMSDVKKREFSAFSWLVCPFWDFPFDFKINMSRTLQDFLVFGHASIRIIMSDAYRASNQVGTYGMCFITKIHQFEGAHSLQSITSPNDTHKHHWNICNFSLKFKRTLSGDFSKRKFGSGKHRFWSTSLSWS